MTRLRESKGVVLTGDRVVIVGCGAVFHHQRTLLMSGVNISSSRSSPRRRAEGHADVLFCSLYSLGVSHNLKALVENLIGDGMALIKGFSLGGQAACGG
jgi:hypothetical protein